MMPSRHPRDTSLTSSTLPLHTLKISRHLQVTFHKLCRPLLDTLDKPSRHSHPIDTLKTPSSHSKDTLHNPCRHRKDTHQTPKDTLHPPSRHLTCTFQTPSIQNLDNLDNTQTLPNTFQGQMGPDRSNLGLPDTFQTPSRHLLDMFQTPTRHPSDTLQTPTNKG